MPFSVYYFYLLHFSPLDAFFIVLFLFIFIIIGAAAPFCHCLITIFTTMPPAFSFHYSLLPPRHYFSLLLFFFFFFIFQMLFHFFTPLLFTFSYFSLAITMPLLPLFLFFFIYFCLFSLFSSFSLLFFDIHFHFLLAFHCPDDTIAFSTIFSSELITFYRCLPDA